MKGDSYSFSTDVYSYSIAVWEIMSQVVFRLPFKPYFDLGALSKSS
jgi:hypothetical protein